MASQRVTFENARGHALAGLVDRPDGTPRAWVLFAHCFTCTKNVRAAAHVASALVERGFAVLRFDFTGLGESEGAFEDTTFSSNVDDLVAAADYLGREHAAPALLVGHSLGGAAVLLAAERIDTARAVATIGAPADAAHVTRHFQAGRKAIEASGEATVDIGGRPFRIRRELVDDLEAQPLPGRVAHLRRALMVMHSPVDAVVGIDNAAGIFTAAKHPKSFVSLDRADHLLSDAADSRYAGAVIAAWADRYLPGSTETAPAVEADAGEVTAVTGREGFRTRVMVGRHGFVADEPAGVGGDDAGPSPYDLLCAALATCTSMTLQMYARRKNIDLAEARVAVTHEKIHARDCADCASRDGRIDRLDRRVWLGGELTAAERTRLLEIADKCPVHRTLHGEIDVRTRLEAGGPG